MKIKVICPCGAEMEVDSPTIGVCETCLRDFMKQHEQCQKQRAKYVPYPIPSPYPYEPYVPPYNPYPYTWFEDTEHTQQLDTTCSKDYKCK